MSGFIGQTGEDILKQLPDDALLEESKGELIGRLGDGTVEEKAWMALKQLERCDCDIVDFGAEAAKLARKAYLEQEEMANWHAIEASVHALDPKLALEVQKLGHRALHDATVAALRIKWLQKDYPSPNMYNLVSILQDELQAVREELKESAAAMTDQAIWVAQPVMAPPAPTKAAADSRYVALSSRMRTSQRRCRCFLCEQEGHFVECCLLGQDVPHYETGRAK